MFSQPSPTLDKQEINLILLSRSHHINHKTRDALTRKIGGLQVQIKNQLPISYIHS